MLDYPTFPVQRSAREPLVQWMLEALEGAGCTILHHTEPDRAPFRITFETRMGERLGIVAYAFRANSKETRNRPLDEHRFQVKYGPDDKLLHDVWQDPFELYTTLFFGINLEHDFFVAADPVLHNPTRFFISIEFKEHHADEILQAGWAAWERSKAVRWYRRAGRGSRRWSQGALPPADSLRAGGQGARRRASPVSRRQDR